VSRDTQSAMKEVVKRVQARMAPLRLTGLRGGARAALVAELVRAQAERPILFLTSTSHASDALMADLRTALGESEDSPRIRAFPAYDSLPYERFSPQPFVIAQRMEILYRWLASAGKSQSAPVVVAPWTALAQRVPSRDLLRGRCVQGSGSIATPSSKPW